MPEPAGVSAPVMLIPTTHVGLEHFFGEQAASLAQAPSVVGEKRGIDQFGGGHIAAHRRRIDRCAANS